MTWILDQGKKDLSRNEGIENGSSRGEDFSLVGVTQVDVKWPASLVDSVK